MSFVLDLRAGANSRGWSFPTSLLDAMDRLRKSGQVANVDVLVGAPDYQLGDERVVSRAQLIDAITRLLPDVRKLPSSFQIRMQGQYGNKQDRVARGAGGLLIDGMYFGIDCWEDHWSMKPLGAVPRSKQPLPPEISGARRYEPAEIVTENRGIVRVEVKKRSNSILAKTLKEIREFLNEQSTDNVTVTLG